MIFFVIVACIIYILELYRAKRVIDDEDHGYKMMVMVLLISVVISAIITMITITTTMIYYVTNDKVEVITESVLLIPVNDKKEYIKYDKENDRYMFKVDEQTMYTKRRNIQINNKQSPHLERTSKTIPENNFTTILGINNKTILLTNCKIVIPKIN